MQIANKHFIVSGAASGLGAATAQLDVSQGEASSIETDAAQGNGDPRTSGRRRRLSHP